MQSIKVWDPFVRLFHWGTALLFLANFAILDEDGAAHRYAGYILLALVLTRLVWGLIGSKHARFTAFWPRPAAIKGHVVELLSGRATPHLSHNPLGALMVYNLLGTLLLICVTGVMLRMDYFWGVDWVEELHEILSNYALFCVGLHIAGVLFESRRSRVNLVKAMVSGRKDFPNHPL